MSDTTTISHRGHQHLLRKCAAILRACGWRVTPPATEPATGWITSRELAHELGIAQSSLCVCLRRRDCPEYFAKRGPTGRILSLVPNAELKGFIMNKCRVIANNSEC